MKMTILFAGISALWALSGAPCTAQTKEILTKADLSPAQLAEIKKITNAIEKFNGYNIFDIDQYDKTRPVLSITLDEPGPTSDQFKDLCDSLQKLGIPAELRLSAGAITDDFLVHLKNTNFLQSLQIESKKLTDAALNHLSDQQNLKQLTAYCGNVTDAGLAHLAKLINLRKLTISSDRVTDAGLAHLAKLVNLQTLKVESKGITDAGYAHLKDLVDLEDLKVGYFGNELGDSQLKYMTRMTKLTQLSVDSKTLTDDGMASLGHLTNLQYLWLDAPKVTKEGIAHLANLKKLESLSVLHCRGLQGDGILALKDLASLRKIVIESSGELNKNNTSFLTGLTGLKSFHFRGNIRERGLEGIKGLTNLEEFVILDSGIDDDNMQYLSGLTKLTNISIYGGELSAKGMKHLGGLNKLTELILQNVPIGDDGLKQLAKLTKLERINAYNCKITGACFKNLVGMTGLKDLDLAGNPIADANVLALKNLQSLKRVDFRGSQVSDEKAIELKKARGDLVVLDVSGQEVRDGKNSPPWEVVDVAKLTADVSMSADEFKAAFDKDRSDKRLSNKVIELTGEVFRGGRNREGLSYISLKAGNDTLLGVFCFTPDDEPWASAAPGQKVKIKGKHPGASYGACLTCCVIVDKGKFEGISVSATDLAAEVMKDHEAAGKKYKKKVVIISGEVEKKEFNSAGAATVFLKTGNKVKMELFLGTDHGELLRSVKAGQKIKIICQNLSISQDNVYSLDCLPCTAP